MADDLTPPLATLLERLQFILAQPLDFTDTDTASTETKVRVLTAAALYFNVLAVRVYGGRIGPVREAGMVEQAVGAAFQGFAGEDPHPDPFEKAAMLLRGITQGHPFNDGNKRTGFLLASYYLHRMGFHAPPDFSEDAAVGLCMQVSAGQIRAIAEIASRLRIIWKM
jgi:death-on-curing protein